MSKYDKASLVHIPSGYKSGTLYNVLPNNADGDFDFTRASTATRVDKNGLIEEISANTPRLDYPLLDGVVQDNPTLLLEPQRINSTTYSQDFTQTSYWGNVIDVVATTNETVAPDGSNTGNKIQANSGTNFKILRTNAFTIPSGITMSMFVKRGNHDYIIFKAQGDYNFNLNTLTWGGSYSNVGYELYPNDWVRLYATTSSSSTSYFGIYITDSSYTQSWNATGDEFVYVWGAQYETGSYPTSYIPTSGSTVTRSAETCNGAGTANDFNDSEGVLYANIAALADDLTFRTLAISDESTSNNIGIGYRSSSNVIYTFLKADINSSTAITVSDITLYNKIAVKYKSGEYAMWINGFKRYSPTTTFTLSGLDEFAFDNGGGDADFYGKTKELMTFKEALSDIELETLTSYRSFNEMATEQLYTIQ